MKLALTNVPPAVAESMARTLVEGGFAACVTALPGRSTYRWKGELCVDDEVTLLMKVGESGAERLRKRVVELHPYELPEFVVLAVEAGQSWRAYLDWVEAGTTAAPGV
jgi:periplasmic divalent cation tolerance protein